MRLRFGLALSALAATLTFSPIFLAQAPAVATAQTAVALHPELLPDSFAGWKRVAPTGGVEANPPSVPQPGFLAEVSHPALQEAEPQRSVANTYARDTAANRLLAVTALEFKDASGALAAFSVLSQPDMREVKGLGTHAVAGQGAVLFLSGATVAVAYPATEAEVPALQALEKLMPKPGGSQALQPLLPTLLPTRGLVAGSLRYALGPRSYLAGGGVLPAAGLGWDKEVEAVTAKYNDRRGAETLTLLLYPTPTIAGPHHRTLEGEVSGLGSSFAKAKTRREGQLVVVASGSFSAEAAQALTENTHIHQLASTDKAMVTPDVVETRKTFGMLANVILFSGILCAGALLLGLFLGGGRALVRVLRGKPAATETEFLSLHLQPQNPSPILSKE